MARSTILILEDEPDIREILEYALRREGYDVVSAGDGTRGLATARRLVPDLVLLDLMLPGMDGLEVCRRLRADPGTAGTAVIMVTAKGEESDVVLGLGLGADDYIAKPFKPKEVVARVRAVLRRTRDAADRIDEQRVVVAGPLRIDPTRHKVTLDDVELPLTATEFRILHYLACRPGRVFTRDQILSASVGENVVVLERNIDVHIRSIRRKLGEQRGLIETVRSIGYRFAELPA
ncbi:MAG: response regulator [Planctomycetota bacterium]|jgi:DNA-binding response OmpR family regulator